VRASCARGRCKGFTTAYSSMQVVIHLFTCPKEKWPFEGPVLSSQSEQFKKFKGQHF